MNIEQLEERQLLATDLAFSLLHDSALDLHDDLPQASGSVANAPGVNLSSLRGNYHLDGAGYAVALIDSGVDYLHPALGGAFGPGATVVGGYDFVDGRGGVFVEGDATPGPDADPMDVTGHGTSVAGIIAANDDVNEGVAPGVDIVALRVLDANGQGRWSWVASALQWVIDHHDEYNIVAVNMSLGDGNLLSTPEARRADVEPKLQQLYDLGIVLVASAGNEFYTNGSQPGLQYPAVSDVVISVGATFDSDQGPRSWPSGAKDHTSGADRVASFTQRSAGLDLLAPGAIITTTHLSGGGHERYLGYAGSSQAAPFVTGAAVLVRQALDQSGQSHLATPAYIRNLLRSTGTQVKDGDDEDDNVKNTGLTFPRLNIEAAIQTVMANAPNAAPSPDRYEDNSTTLTAGYFGRLQNQTIRNLSWHTTTDLDWYAFRVEKESDFRIVLDVGNGVAPKFVFHDVSVGRERVLTATVQNGVAVLDVHLRVGVRYFLEVTAPNTTGFYDLRITDRGLPTNPGGNSPQAGPVSSTPDRFENNNTEQQATFLGFVRTSTFERLSLHNSGDVDWYRFLSLQEGGRRIEVEPVNPANANLRFTLIDSSSGATKQLQSRREGGIAVLETSFDILNYLIKVENLSGAPVEYKLRIGPIKDGVEPNNEMLDEVALGNVRGQSAFEYSIHTPGDIDWYRFQAEDDYYRIKIKATETNVEPQFTFHDFSKNRERTIESVFENGVAFIDVNLRSRVNYFLEAKGGDKDIFEYELDFEKIEPPQQSGEVSAADQTDVLDAFFSNLNIDTV